MNNYKETIKVTTNEKGEVVITMPHSVHTRLLNDLYDAYKSQEQKNLNYTAKDTFELWEAIDNE